MTRSNTSTTPSFVEDLRYILTSDCTETFLLEWLETVEKHTFTQETVKALVDTIRQHAVVSSTYSPDVLVDLCGTGGDKHHTFNISTAASFVVAGAGLKVAKHGNRKLTSSSGSVDVLEALHINFQQDIVQHEQSLRDNNLTFLSAQHVYPALKQLSLARKKFGKPTIFNCLGPLTNPFAVTTQVIGCYREEDQEMLARTLYLQGKTGIVLTGHQGLDEASTSGVTTGIRITRKGLEPFTVHPHDVGIRIAPLDAIKGGSPEVNAEMMQRIFRGDKGPIYDVVVLNAGIALYAAQVEDNLDSAVKLARRTIASGDALRVLTSLQGESK